MGRYQRIITKETEMFAKEYVYTGVLIPKINEERNIIGLLFNRLRRSEKLYYLLMDGMTDYESDTLINGYIKKFLVSAKEAKATNPLLEDGASMDINTYQNISVVMVEHILGRFIKGVGPFLKLLHFLSIRKVIPGIPDTIPV
jgi:hypothetical protein